MNNTDKISYWHNKTFFDGEKERMDPGEPLLYDKILESKVIQTTTGTIHIIDPAGEGLGNGIANIRVSGDFGRVRLENIRTIEPYKCIETLYKASGADSFDFTSNGKCIPHIKALTCEKDRNIDHETNLTITYDIVSFTPTKSEYKFRLNRYQCYNYNVTDKVDISPANIVQKIVCKFENPVSDVKLQLNDDSDTIINLNAIDGYTWEIDFGETVINMSRINEVELLCLSKSNNKVTTITTSYNTGYIRIEEYYRLVGVLTFDV